MDKKSIANTRLLSQKILQSDFISAKEIVSYMGVMQAQDFRMAKWAIGLRLKNATEKLIDSAIDAGEIIRTHVLRPTWHFVSSGDIYQMLDLTASRIQSSMKGRNKQLELSDSVFKKCNEIFEKILAGNKHLTRKEMISELHNAKIKTDNNRASHILMNAESDGIICSGKMKANQITYALLNEIVPKPISVIKEEALFLIAKKYFTSHAPATLQDFTWWAGLSLTDGKKAIDSLKKSFISEEIDGKKYWFPESFKFQPKEKSSLCLLPAFDEYIISYKDRSAAISTKHQSKAFSNNGIFWPTIVINGQVCGLWKREIKNNKLMIETYLFDELDANQKNLIKEAERFGYFLNLKTEVIKKS